MVPHLRSFRVVAQDLPGHGASPLPRSSVTDTIADAEALLDELGLGPHHPGFLPDPPDVATDLAALRCPMLVTLCTGTTPAEAEWMVPFRQGLHDHLARGHGPVRSAWLPTSHMMVLTHPEQTADLVTEFVGDQVT